MKYLLLYYEFNDLIILFIKVIYKNWMRFLFVNYIRCLGREGGRGGELFSQNLFCSDWGELKHFIWKQKPPGSWYILG